MVGGGSWVVTRWRSSNSTLKQPEKMASSYQPSHQSLDKALLLLVRVAEDEGATSLSALAQEVDLPVSTVHRLLSGLGRAGFIAAVRRGQYVRSEERRVGKECVCTFRSRWKPYHDKTNNINLHIIAL